MIQTIIFCVLFPVTWQMASWGVRILILKLGSKVVEENISKIKEGFKNGKNV